MAAAKQSQSQVLPALYEDYHAIHSPKSNNDWRSKIDEQAIRNADAPAMIVDIEFEVYESMGRFLISEVVFCYSKPSPVWKPEYGD